MITSKVFNFALIFRDGHKQLRISLLSGEEAMDDLVDIGETSCGPDLLEGVFDIEVSVHLLLHLLLQE